MALRAMVSKSSFDFVVISPPITTTFDLTKVSHATRLYLSPARHASRTASEMVSATLSGWPSPTDSEEKMNRLLINLLPTILVRRTKISTYQDAKIRRCRMESMGKFWETGKATLRSSFRNWIQLFRTEQSESFRVNLFVT